MGMTLDDEALNILSACKCGSTGVTTSAAKIKGVPVKDVFRGNALVNWLLANVSKFEQTGDRESAASFCQSLLQAGALCCVDPEGGPFDDGNSWYKWSDTPNGDVRRKASEGLPETDEATRKALAELDLIQEDMIHNNEPGWRTK
eukprot:Colp12_sorted_trinity150504_noHs@3065